MNNSFYTLPILIAHHIGQLQRQAELERALKTKPEPVKPVEVEARCLELPLNPQPCQQDAA